MARSYGQILGVILVTSLLSLQVHCERATSAEPPASEVVVVSASSYESLLTRPLGGGHVRFYWCGGHLRLDPPKYRKGSANLNTETVNESLTVSARKGLPSAMYRLTQQTANGTRMVKMDVVDAETIDLQIVEPSGEETRIHQSPAGNIDVTLIRGEETFHCTGATWLHLYAEHATHFSPVVWEFVNRLVPGRPIEALAREVELEVLRRADESDSDREKVRLLVDALRSNRRSDRAEAKASLLKMGSVAVVHLTEMSPDHWDAEQLATVQSIFRRVRPAAEDYAGSLSRQLASDESYRQAISSNVGIQSNVAIRASVAIK